MSAGARETDAPQPAAPAAEQAALDPQQPDHEQPGHQHHLHLPLDEPVLLEPKDDDWAWRRRIRSNPHQLGIYRVVVGIAGALLVVLGIVSGPLPGPGGIPLVLLGLAVWSSEFLWAHRLMLRFKHALHVFRSWSRGRQAIAWVVFFTCCGLFGYGYLLVIGVPVWLPHGVVALLQRLPGV